MPGLRITGYQSSPERSNGPHASNGEWYGSGVGKLCGGPVFQLKVHQISACRGSLLAPVRRPRPLGLAVVQALPEQSERRLLRPDAAAALQTTCSRTQESLSTHQCVA